MAVALCLVGLPAAGCGAIRAPTGRTAAPPVAARTGGTLQVHPLPARGTPPASAPGGGRTSAPARATRPPRARPAKAPAAPPPQNWDVPAAPAANYLAGPDLLLSESGGHSSFARPAGGGRMVSLLGVNGAVGAAVSDLHGGVWYVAGNGNGTLLWSDGRQVRVFSWRGAAAARPAADLNLTVAPDGSAWLLFVVPTAGGGTPGNLLGVGDAGGRAVAVHVSLGGGVQTYRLPPLVGAGITGLAVAPDGQIWFCTTQPGGAIRALYAYDPAEGTAQPFNLPVLGRALQVEATPAGVWIRVQAPAGPTSLLQVDPQSGAAATVLHGVTGLAVSPGGALLAAVDAAGTGEVYRIDTRGDRDAAPVLQIPHVIVGLAASSGALWALTANRLYRGPD